MSEPGEVQFGNTAIPYTIVRSTRRKKTVEITLDPNNGVLVAAPIDTPADRIEAIVRRRSERMLPEYNLLRLRLKAIGPMLTFLRVLLDGGVDHTRPRT